jgi:hypothetical protein
MTVSSDDRTPIPRMTLSELQFQDRSLGLLFTAEYRNCMECQMIKRLQKCRKERVNERISVNTAMILSFMR